MRQGRRVAGANDVELRVDVWEGICLGLKTMILVLLALISIRLFSHQI